MSNTTPKGFVLHTPETTGGQASELLQKAKQKFGFLPNFMSVAGEAPETINAYNQLQKDFDNSSLSEAERQVVYLTASTYNGCHFCVPAHSAAVKKSAAIDDQVAESLRTGEKLGDEKLEALAEFTRTMLKNQGNVPSGELDKFLKAGHSRQKAMEVTIGLAAKTITNFINNLAETPLNDELSEFKWNENSSTRNAA